MKILTLLLVSIFMLGLVSSFNFTNGTAAHYALDGTTGAVVDSLGLHNAINNGSLRGVEGKIDEAFNLTVNDYINLSTNFMSDFSNGSVQLWFKIPDNTVENILFSSSNPTSNDLVRMFITNGGKLAYGRFKTAGTNNQVSGNTTITEDTWHHVVFISTGSSYQIYLDGYPELLSLDAGDNDGKWFNDLTGANFDVTAGRQFVSGFSYLNGVIDELALWNRSINSTEILELWNSGSGLNWNPTIITLDSPGNDTTISDIGTNFSVSGDVGTGFNSTNVTYYIWNNESSLHNTSVVSWTPSGTGNQTFNVTFNIDDFVLGNYTWNAKVCWENSTFYNCSLSSTNSTFSVIPFSVLAENYSTNVLEGDLSTFTANISIITTERLSVVSFIYNGTSYTSTATEYDTNKWFLTRNQQIPVVTSSENVSFYWSIKLESGFISNTTSHNQTILKIGLDDCSVYTIQLFNLTLVDEDNQTVLNGTIYNTSINVDIGLFYLDGTTKVIGFNKSYKNVNPARVCLQYDVDNSSLRLDAIIQYSSNDRFVEFYNIKNYIINNNTKSQNITLYNLNSSKGQEFKITYKDSNFNTVPGAIIQVQRNYIDEGVFKTVEIPQIGGDGTTIAHLVRNDVIYNLIVIRNGTVLGTFSNVVASCQNPALSSCEININSFSSGSTQTDYSTDSVFTSSISYNKTTRVVSTTFAILSGVPALTSLNVTLWDSHLNTTVCSDSLTSAGGTLSCTIPSNYGNTTVVVEVISDGVVKRKSIIVLANTPENIYGNSLVFVGLIILFLIVGMSVTDNPMMLGIMLIVGSILLVVMNITTNTGWIGGGATILWFIIAIIIILIKGSNRQ